jgi:hypothetical protein
MRKSGYRTHRLAPSHDRLFLRRRVLYRGHLLLVEMLPLTLLEVQEKVGLKLQLQPH